MDLSLLATLKRKLVEAKEFHEVWQYFLDHFGEDEEFIAQGQRTRDAFLETVLAQVGRQIFHDDVEVADLLLTRLPEHRFVHGGFVLNGRVASVLYFEDIQVGMLVVVMSFASSETRLVRFSGRPVRPPPAHSWQPSDN